MSIILEVVAEKIVNKGGGIRQRTKEKGPGYIVREAWREAGSDYVIFKCPHCGHRNNRCILDFDYSTEGKLGVKCKMCRGDVEVKRPPDQQLEPLIVDPKDYRPPKGANPWR